MKLTKKDKEYLKRRFKLSDREIDVIEAIYKGKDSDADISKELKIKIGTTKRHIHEILIKTNQRSKLSLVLKLLDSLDLE